MKRVIKASTNADELTKENIINAIKNQFGCSDKPAKIIYKWYGLQGTYDDFTSLKEFMKFLSKDIYDMVDMCSDGEEWEIVSEALGLLEED